MKSAPLLAGAVGTLSSVVHALPQLLPRALPISITDPLFIEAVLDAHNTYRAFHSAGPLVWNPQAAEVAHTVANNIASTCVLAHSGLGYGENLYGTCCSAPDEVTGTIDGVTAWYNEVTSYNFADPGFSSATGHFTQVVWNSTTSVGCAWADTQCGIGWAYFVCEYAPPGNVIGEFAQNVFPGQGTTAPTIIPPSVVSSIPTVTSTPMPMSTPQMTIQPTNTPPPMSPPPTSPPPSGMTQAPVPNPQPFPHPNPFPAPFPHGPPHGQGSDAEPFPGEEPCEEEENAGPGHW